MKTIQSNRRIDPGKGGARNATRVAGHIRGRCGQNSATKPRLSPFFELGKQPILVPVDFTAASDKALDHALSLAGYLEAPVVLLHVVERRYAEGFLDTPAKSLFRREAHDQARKRLDAMVESKSNCLAPIKRIVCSGIAELEILRLAENMDVALIVLGRPRRNLLSRWLWGSVSDDIIDIAPCPVLVVNGQASMSPNC
jgi:nucleotide-binding universal stress UspA family protein